MRAILTILIGSLAAAALPAQSNLSAIQATGNATINVTPDQAQIDVGVVTQGATAQEAGTLNAAMANTVQTALKAVLGTSGTIQTINYSVYPRYNNNSTTIVGYTATNTIRVITTNLSILGTLIDTANQAGAGNVSGISFGLQNPDPFVQQALTAASKAALGHASAIASGLGVRLGAVVSASESSSYTPIVAAAGAPVAATTPVQSGTVGVSATVTVSVALAAASAVSTQSR